MVENNNRDRLVNPINLDEETLSNYDPFSRPFIDHYCSENEAKVYLTREDILELGFLRSNAERKIFKHKNKITLILEQYTIKDYSVKDLAVEETRLYYLNPFLVLLYVSTKPNKENIQQIIDNYAG